MAKNSPLTYNEGLACDAIVRLIEARVGVQRAHVRTHDNDPDPARRVELTFQLGPQLYAIEHTGIEPFPDFMRMNGDSSRLFDPITQGAASAIMPDEVIELHMPLGALLDIGQKELKRRQAALVDFIIHTAPQVPLRSYADYVGDIKPSTLPGVPFPVTLYRFEALGSGARIQIKHLVPNTGDQLRADRLLRACDAKFPKLARWKASSGARTVLVLEDNDIQLTNPANVAEAYLPIALARNDRPDETYLVMTCNTIWYAWPILVAGDTYFDLSQRVHPLGVEIDPRQLSPITSR